MSTASSLVPDKRALIHTLWCRAAVLERMPVIEKTSGQSNGVSSGESVKDKQPVKVMPAESLPQPPADQVEGRVPVSPHRWGWRAAVAQR